MVRPRISSGWLGFSCFRFPSDLQTGWLSITQRLLFFQWPDCTGLFTSSFHLPHVPVIWILILLILTTNNRIVTHNTENIKPVMVVHCFNLSTWKAEGASPVYCELQANQNNIRKTLFQNQTKPQMNKNTNNSKCILWFPKLVFICFHLESSNQVMHTGSLDWGRNSSPNQRLYHIFNLEQQWLVWNLPFLLSQNLTCWSPSWHCL